MVREATMPWNHAAANVSRQDGPRTRSRRVDDAIHLSPAGYEQLSKWVTAALSGTEEGDCIVWIADGCSVYRSGA